MTTPAPRSSPLSGTRFAAVRVPASAADTPAVRLDRAVFDQIFPFHLLLDSTLRVRSCGPVVARLDPTLASQQVGLLDRFDILAPTGVDTYARIIARLHRSFVLRAKVSPALELRGQFVTVNNMHRLAFLCTPRLTSQTLETLGLSVEDFPAHDGIADYLALFQAQRMALVEAANLSEDLAVLNTELDRRVALRTHEFEAANEQLRGTSRDLAAALTELRDAKRQLELELAERARMESELRLAHRLEAVGQLAAGIAHEINTPIQYVSDSVHFVRDALGDLLPFLERASGSEAWDDLDGDFLVQRLPEAIARSLDGLDRVARIVRAMKGFAHPGSSGKEPADVNAMIENTLSVCRNEYKYVAEVVTDLGPVPPVTCCVAELGQVILNLVVNAAHAISARVEGTAERGRIVIRTEIDRGAVLISITDDGCGIPEEVRSRIFDPFFTTKPVGKGTGQGLAISRNIVVRHGGTIAFTTETGHGTTFAVRLPLAPAGGADAATGAADGQAAGRSAP